MSWRCSFSSAVKVSSRPRNSRIWSPRPVRMLLTSVWMISRFGMPPPVRMVPMLASVRSVVGNADEFGSGMVSPLFSSSGDGSGGAISSTCCEPSRTSDRSRPGCSSAASRRAGSPASASATQFFSSIYAHAADEHVGDPDPAVHVERQRVRHLDVDRHLVRPGARAAGQRHVRDALPATRRQHQPRRRQRDRRAAERTVSELTASRALLLQRAAVVLARGRGRRRCAGPGRGGAMAPSGSPGITPGAGAGGGPGCGYHGGGSGLFSL